MYTVISEWAVGRYSVLELDKDLPMEQYSKYCIKGIEYVPVPVYDLPRHIAIEAKGNFKGEAVEFV